MLESCSTYNKEQAKRGGSFNVDKVQLDRFSSPTNETITGYDELGRLLSKKIIDTLKKIIRRVNKKQ